MTTRQFCQIGACVKWRTLAVRQSSPLTDIFSKSADFDVDSICPSLWASTVNRVLRAISSRGTFSAARVGRSWARAPKKIQLAHPVAYLLNYLHTHLCTHLTKCEHIRSCLIKHLLSHPTNFGACSPKKCTSSQYSQHWWVVAEWQSWALSVFLKFLQ